MASVPAATFDPQLLLEAQGVRVAFFDADGVLTDGGVRYAELAGGGAAETVKRFHVLDGLGLQLLQRAGIVPAVVSGRDSAALRARLNALGVEHVHCAVADKVAAAERVLGRLGADWPQAAAMGDDWPDLRLLERCAFSCAPPGAHAEVRARVSYVTSARAGHGAAREFCDVLLTASGRYRELLAEHLA